MSTPETTDRTPADWLVYVLWEHYPEGLPPWEEVPLHIRKGLVRTATKIREALRERC